MFGDIIPTIMDDETLKNAIQTLTEQLLALESAMATLKVSVIVLKVISAGQMYPDDPTKGIEQFRILEERVLQADPHAPARQQAAEAIEAVKLWRKHGGGKHH